MKKERNRRGKLIGMYRTQIIQEAPLTKKGKPNPRYPGQNIIRHIVPTK